MHSIISITTLSLALSLVHASPFQSLSRRAPTSISGYDYAGCYTEATTQRALTGSSFFDDRMTVEKCAAACSKFSTFGVEYGRECYCGDTLNEGSVSAPESECSKPCPGNAAQMCGDGNRLSLYTRPAGTTTTSSTTTTALPTPGSFSAMGCFTEATNGRALGDKTFFDNAMTVEKCAMTCADYDLFGVEYYHECYCGDALQPGSVSAPSSDCSHPCDGDASEICGGDNRLNVYSFGKPPTTAAPPAPSSYVSDGCYTEATNSRALTGSVFYDDLMTVEKCASVCDGYDLFGVEYGRECYCGNIRMDGSVQAPSSECGKTCPGNKAEKCGGGNRLNIYHFEQGDVTSSTSLPSASSTISSSVTSVDTLSSSGTSSVSSSELSSSTMPTTTSESSSGTSLTSTTLQEAISTTSSTSQLSSSATSESSSTTSLTSTTLQEAISTTSSTSQLSSSATDSISSMVTTTSATTESTSTTSSTLKPTPTGPPNLLANPGFEAVDPEPVVWAAGPYAANPKNPVTNFQAKANSDLSPHSGTQMVMISSQTGGSSDSHIYQLITTTPNTNYNLSYWFWVPKQCTMRIYVQPKLSGANVYSKDASFKQADLSKWNQFSGSFNSGQYSSLYVYTLASCPSKTTIYYDDWSVTQA